MRDDGKRPIAVGPITGSLHIENGDPAHVLLEMIDAHPWVRTLVDERERVAFLAGYRAACPNHTDEFTARAALKALTRWISSGA